MKIPGFLLAAALGVVGIGSTADAQPRVFTTSLGNFENPPTGSPGVGSLTLTMDVTAHTLTLDMSFSGLTGTTTAAHIHCCTAPPGNAGVATQTPTFTGFPAGVQAGTYFRVFDTTLASSFNAAFITASGGTVASAEARLFAALQAGEAYFNLHTSTYGGGEIRGFLSPLIQDLVVDFGASYGTWTLGGLSGWQLIHGFSPDAQARELVASGSMVTGDLDGNGLDDLVIDFGAPYGVWIWMNHATWTPLHGLSPTRMVTGDLDGNGKDEIILDFPGYGLWRFSNNTTWSQLHGLSATQLATGNLDGTGGEEVLVNFAGAGLWRFHNTTGWTLLHGFDITRIVTADLDGNGLDDVVAEFAGLGLWAYRNNATWATLDTASTTELAAGDLDGNGRDELVVDYGVPYGLYVYSNDTSWAFLHPLSAEALAVGDLDGGGRADVVIDFGAQGLYVYRNNATWQLLHTLSPEAITIGRLH